MFKKFLRYLERKGRKSIIMDRDNISPYLVRYYVAYPDGARRQRKDIPFNIFVHQFWQSDEPVLHDHPWWYFTIILKGGYWETTPKGTFWRRPGSMRFNRGGYHYISIPEPGKTWTLFIRGKKIREWGFLDDGVWVPWYDYLEEHGKV